MMRFVMILVAVFTVSVLSACTPDPANEEIKPAGDPSLPKTPMVKWSEELPIQPYPGASLMVSSRKGDQKISMYTSKDSYTKIVSYYKDFFTNDKWSIITVDETPTESSIIASKGKLKLTVEVTAPQENVGPKSNTINITSEPRG